MIHRQAEGILLENAKHHAEAAREIDGELSDHEKDDVRLRLKALLYFIQNWTAETRLAIMEGGR
jgi:hypothetical protein